MAGVMAATMAPAAHFASAANIGNEGCTPGYWKNHTSNWQEYKPTTRLDQPWDFPSELASFENVTMLQALQGGGGAGLDGAAKILLRASTAAYLNAAHEGVGYPYRRLNEPGELRMRINAALASLDRQGMLDLAAELDRANSLGCPL
ncbi:MAG: hypothetical protein H0U16_02810 [Actinobacteria bacterium]|nr:hypothetical protein [Actinomycetota bacterium]